MCNRVGGDLVFIHLIIIIFYALIDFLSLFIYFYFSF